MKHQDLPWRPQVKILSIVGVGVGRCLSKGLGGSLVDLEIGRGHRKETGQKGSWLEKDGETLGQNFLMGLYLKKLCDSLHAQEGAGKDVVKLKLLFGRCDCWKRNSPWCSETTPGSVFWSDSWQCLEGPYLMLMATIITSKERDPWSFWSLRKNDFQRNLNHVDNSEN